MDMKGENEPTGTKNSITNRRNERGAFTRAIYGTEMDSDGGEERGMVGGSSRSRILVGDNKGIVCRKRGASFRT